MRTMIRHVPTRYFPCERHLPLRCTYGSLKAKTHSPSPARWVSVLEMYLLGVFPIDVTYLWDVALFSRDASLGGSSCSKSTRWALLGRRSGLKQQEHLPHLPHSSASIRSCKPFKMDKLCHLPLLVQSFSLGTARTAGYNDIPPPSQLQDSTQSCYNDVPPPSRCLSN